MVISVTARTRGSRTSRAISSVRTSRRPCSTRCLRWLTLLLPPGRGDPVVAGDRLVAGAGAIPEGIIDAIIEQILDGSDRRRLGVKRDRVLGDRRDLGAAGGHRDPDDLVDQRQRLLAIAAGDRDAELAAAPRVPDVRRADLVDEHADPVAHAILDPPDDHALVLQRTRVSEQQADPGHADVHNVTLPRVLRACQGSTATCPVSRTCTDLQWSAM